MKPPEIAAGVWLLSHHVDALEVSCSVSQVSLLLGRCPERLQPRLEWHRSLARRQRPWGARDMDLVWPHGPTGPAPVRMHPGSMRSKYPYTLETEDWLAFIAPARAAVPRVVVQFRASSLVAHGAARSFVRVREWFEAEVIDQVGGRVEGESPAWRISRLDIASDLAGVDLRLNDLPMFSTRAKRRKGHLEGDGWSGDDQ